MKAALVVQGASEDVAIFTARLNEELARLGGQIREVKMACGIHEATIAGRHALPRVLNSVLVLYEENA